MVQQGFTSAGRRDVALAIAEKYFTAMVEAYTRNKTINESLSPVTLDGWGQPNFVGFGGIGPIANFIEYVLGFELDAPRNTVTWHIHRTERHGIENVKIAAVRADFLCEARSAADDAVRLTVNSDGPFTLRTVFNGVTAEHPIQKGNATVRIG
jgi:hypothetical protein